MSKCKDECADHVQELLKQIEQLKDQLATADKHIGWLEADKIRLNKSIKIRDGAMDGFVDLEEVTAKKLATAQAENDDLQAGINCGTARYDKLWNERVELQADNKRLRDALQSLHDQQNGPPLIRRQKQWQAANDEAEKLLDKVEP